MKFILGIFALAGATCVTLIFVQPGSFSAPADGPKASPQKAAPQPHAAPAVAASAPVRVAAASPAPTARPASTPHASGAAPKPASAPAPGAARPAAAPAPAPGPSVTIQPPNGLEGVAFGTPADQIAVRFPPAWRRQTADELTYVFYPKGQGNQVRFHFDRRGLCKLELLLKPAQGQDLTSFYNAVRQQYAATYGSLPGNHTDTWSDGHTVVHVGMDPTGVSVQFYPRG